MDEKCPLTYRRKTRGISEPFYDTLSDLIILSHFLSLFGLYQTYVLFYNRKAKSNSVHKR